ncbi:MAG: hypothetical protein JW832_04350 [Deltaproteobacteria bacterium]|nr:hypothetical protein [Deltaproteobacteria bacterium]
MKPYLSRYCLRSLSVVAIIGLLCLLAPASASARENVTSERAKAVIGGKSPDALFFDVHGFKFLKSNRLEVAYNPMIYDADGAALTLKELKTPCEAYVEYRRVEGEDPRLFRLEVQGYGDNATSLFTEKKKPKRLPE